MEGLRRTVETVQQAKQRTRATVTTAVRDGQKMVDRVAERSFQLGVFSLIASEVDLVRSMVERMGDFSNLANLPSDLLLRAMSFQLGGVPVGEIALAVIGAKGVTLAWRKARATEEGGGLSRLVQLTAALAGGAVVLAGYQGAELLIQQAQGVAGSWPLVGGWLAGGLEMVEELLFNESVGRVAVGVAAVVAINGGQNFPLLRQLNTIVGSAFAPFSLRRK